jgi:hyperosmotically inducible protein
MDDTLRWQVARAIYGNPVLSRYGLGALPSIHIIVDDGHVTLEGVVSTEMDKQIAGMQASSAGLSFGQVVNNLRVENPSSKKS